MTEALGRLVTTLDVIGLEAFVPKPPRGPGRPPQDRRALARAFVAKAMLGIPTTSALIEQLAVDKSLRRILGWERLASALRSHVLSRLRRVRAGRSARQNARGADRALARRAHRRRDRPRRHRDRGAREAGGERSQRQEGRSAVRWRSAGAQARTPAQGRATAKARADAAGAANLTDRQPNARRTAHRMRCRLQENSKGSRSPGSATSCISTSLAAGSPSPACSLRPPFTTVRSPFP